jgi:hypothetical protein
MLTVLGSPRRCCDGVTRRESLKAGALSVLGGFFNLPDLFALEKMRDPVPNPGKAKSVILLYLLGGAATQDMYDLKPAAPSGVRSEFKPIPTTAPGIQVCEHLPLTASWMHRAAIVRTVNHKAGCHNCLPSYSGCEVPQPDQHPRDTHPPSMGSVCEYLQASREEAGDFPDYVYLPCWLGWGQVFRRGGPYAGFLGPQYDALTTECTPYYDAGTPAPKAGYPRIVRGEPKLPSEIVPAGITIDGLDKRRTLLQQIDGRLREAEATGSVGIYSRQRRQAFDLLTSSKVKAAFDLRKEEPRRRERYGNTLFGNSALIARRLVEEGVRFVNVTWDLFWDRVQVDYDAWDTHTRNFPILRENKLPHLDQTYSALLEDLHDRGLLDETLVVVMSEMGRTPRINAAGGRDHWTNCYSVLFAGGGIRGGTVYGSSDSQAAFVKDLPVSTSDICATIYACLGINPEMTLPDRSGRPIAIAHGGQAIQEILAGGRRPG